MHPNDTWIANLRALVEAHLPPGAKTKAAGYEAVAAATGINKDYIYQLCTGKKRKMGLDAADKIRRAFAYGRDPSWLEQPPEPVNPSKDPAEPAARLSVAQNVIHLFPTVVAPTIGWGEIKVESVPKSFTLVLRDGALGDDFPRGAVGYFEKYEPGVVEPIEGKGVLFVDREGAPFVRLYEVQRGSTWRAVAAAKGYAPMDSEQDGLTLLAVMLGGFWRPPTR